MKYYTESIPVTLAEKLKEKGMPMELWHETIQGMPYITIMEKSSFDWLDKELGNTPSEVEVRYSIPTFGACFDWLMSEKGIYVRIVPFQSTRGKQTLLDWSWYIDQANEPYIENDLYWHSWHEAAEKAIEKALELL